MAQLAVNGGSRSRTGSWPAWPIWDERDAEAVADVVRSGKWGRLVGDRVQTFEKTFAAYQGAEFGIAVVNGSVSLRIALLAAGIKAGDEVVVPPYTFSATAMSVVEANAVPIFADIAEDTACLDADAFERAITPRTRAVIPVHLGGQAADMERICAIAKQHGIAVIEDAAHAHGACYQGKGLGTVGDIGSFSFQASKNLTSGEGGIILTNDPELADLCHSIHHCGRARGGGWYEHRILGCNYRLSEMQAALLLTQLERLEGQTERRNANGLYLNEQLTKIPGILPMARGLGEDRHSYHLYPFRYDAAAFGGASRERFVAALVAEGIPCSEGYTIPLYRQEFFLNKAFGPYTGWRESRPDLDYASMVCPVCERFSTETGVWFSQPMLLGTREDMDDIVRAVRKIQENCGEL
jgi:dTDP-4-amino-4,6-dideoxygalactose transaminase